MELKQKQGGRVAETRLCNRLDIFKIPLLTPKQSRIIFGTAFCSYIYQALKIQVKDTNFTWVGSLPALAGLLVDQAKVWAEPQATLLIFLP